MEDKYSLLDLIDSWEEDLLQCEADIIQADVYNEIVPSYGILDKILNAINPYKELFSNSIETRFFLYMN